MIKENIKNLLFFIKSKDLEYKPYRIFTSIDGKFIHVNEEECSNMKYFCDNEGIKYGNNNFNQIVIPKNILIEAFQKYMT